MSTWIVVVYERDGQRGAVSTHGTWRDWETASAFSLKIMNKFDYLLAHELLLDGKTLKAVAEASQ